MAERHCKAIGWNEAAADSYVNAASGAAVLAYIGAAGNPTKAAPSRILARAANSATYGEHCNTLTTNA